MSEIASALKPHAGHSRIGGGFRNAHCGHSFGRRIRSDFEFARGASIVENAMVDVGHKAEPQMRVGVIKDQASRRCASRPAMNAGAFALA
jgi:hypothetical protein